MALWDTFKMLLLTAVTVYLLPIILLKNVPSDMIHGSCDPDFKAVALMYRDNFESGFDRGGSLAVYYKGRKVCDMWAGYADEAIQRPWRQDTVGVLFSVSKMMAALSLLKLNDSGKLDYSKPVTHYWPEFGQNGKESITVQELVSHSAGLAATDPTIPFSQIISDPDAVGRAFEQQVPNWTPGEKHGYHGLTFGPLMDQLLRRIDPKRRSLQNYFKEEISVPYGIDVHIGLPLSEHHRAAVFQGPGWIQLLKRFLGDPGFILTYYRMTRNPLFTKAFDLQFSDEVTNFDQFVNWPEARIIPQGSTNGYSNAQAIAKLLSAFTNEGKMPDGKQFVSAETVNLFSTPVHSGEDAIITVNTTLGYGVFHTYEGNNRHRIGHVGYGGQMGHFDRINGFSYSYVTNYGDMVMDESDRRAVRIRRAIYESLDKMSKT